MQTIEKFQYFVIGGGSGGIASARRAAAWGAKVGVAEYNRWGGTCVNVGCVPKKMMWWASTVREILSESKHYGFEMKDTPTFDWKYMKSRRDHTINKLNGIYKSNLEKSNVTYFNNFATFVDPERPHLLQVGNTFVEADHILIATGSYPSNLEVPGEEFTIDSDGFFDLENIPKNVAVLGAGYIAVELAGVLNGLGAKTSLFVRFDTVLRKFDEMLKSGVHKEMERHGVTIVPNLKLSHISKSDDGLLTIHTHSSGNYSGFDCVLKAIGRTPNIDKLGLSNTKINTAKGKLSHIIVDEFQNTSVDGIYALGDVCGKVELTPMAIAAGRRLADRIFGNIKESKADYEFVPTVVFSHPPIGTIGLTEEEAKAKYGDGNFKVYTSTGVNMYYSAFDMDPLEKPRTHMKLICVGDDEKIVGLHVIGMAADEMLQGFGVAVKMGATKSDLDNCVAIHPTAAEEMVTMAPWGLKKGAL